ncbi:16S rRNA (cytosine967-C5)-methyltransferase [Melghirimyces profundicolus]|uniref:16S rRNA (cytosine(967)-C(5))-methyltransferase n=1 Tax=Melghirimyces profundicolus TaxID=1242148 RepID=A0A2T6BYR3_9BACL|nr:16S rRNA (cytosine(967)-C(5))-methyltransferase RsmB [Melghirimyces profundicolus]PTX61220.1 16S rRNA (cytosine967-C5)-methyltransferase [Melghirimyces profundicolus]
MARRKTARDVALDVLMAVEERGAYSNLLLNDALTKSGLSSRDRGLATELVYGTIQRRNTLDWILNGLVKKGVTSLEPWVRHLLRMGIYQLRYLDRIPGRAAVHETVRMAKERGHRGVSGLVNGVLRSYQRRRREWTLPEDPETPEKLALATSHPEWMVRRLMEVYGKETARAVLEAGNRPPRTAVRVNPLKSDRETVARLLSEQNPGMEVEASPLSSQGLILKGGGNPARGLLFREGWVTIQDESSMLVSEVVDPRPGERVLDGCAAPGGKTGHLGERMKNEGVLFSCDLHPHKIRLIEDQVRRLGLTIVEARRADLRELPGNVEPFDRVLLDAPCSGLGVIRRKPDIKWSKEPREVASLTSLQAQLLDAAAELVVPGGTLVYSTCTLEPKENAEQVSAFLERHPEFRPDGSLEDRLPEAVREKALRGEGWVQILPHHFDSDGFFIARMIKAK